MILMAFTKALAQLPDRRFRRVLWRGIGLTIALFIGLYMLTRRIITWLASGPIDLPGLGPVTWLGEVLNWGTFGAFIVLSIFLMVPVASAITSLFLDQVAQAVEDKHYPILPAVPHVSVWDGLRDSVNFMGLLIGANIAAFALYLLMPPAAPFIFYALNGFLLGREYFQLVAMRREGRQAAKALRQKHQGTIWAAGCLMAVPLSIPLINLIIPILGAATFTHLYHRLSQR